MNGTSTVLQKSIRLSGRLVPGATDRQQKIPAFDQHRLGLARVVCIGAGGIMSNIAPTLVRKGIGEVRLFDDDDVESSNLNRQRFYSKDIGKVKAFALAENLLPECIVRTSIVGYAWRFEQAIQHGVTLDCDIAICGVDNNPTRVAVARHFRGVGIPVVFAAVSEDANHGYVFVQNKTGPCLGCLYPDVADSRTYPCPGTPAIADILQAVGSLAVYAIDTCVMGRPREWNYRRIYLSDGNLDSAQRIQVRTDCRLGIAH